MFVAPGSKLGLEMYVFGPETHMTAIVGMALGNRPIPKVPKPDQQASQTQPLNLLGKNVRQCVGDITHYVEFLVVEVWSAVYFSFLACCV